jgi:hypothetical protein
MAENVSRIVLNYYIRTNDQITGDSEAIKVTKMSKTIQEISSVNLLKIIEMSGIVSVFIINM